MMKAKPLTEEEKYMQTQRTLEKELIKLKRQYLVLDRARRFTTHYKLIKGETVISIFKKEYDDILRDLGRAAAPGRIASDEKVFDVLGTHLDSLTAWNHRVHARKVDLKELDGEIKKYEKQVQYARKQQITDRQYEDRIVQALKTIEELENKLEVQMIKFGTICSKNRELREEIEHQLCIRRVFLTQWNRLIEKLMDGKKIMLDLIEQASIAYNQREEWCNKLTMLRHKAFQNINFNMTEMQEHKRMLDKNTKLQEFFTIKGQKRTMHDLEEKERLKRKQHEEALHRKFAAHQQVLDDIKTFSRNSDVIAIAENFAKQEELNFSYFTFVLEMIREMEDMNDRLGFLYLDIDELYVLNEARTYQQTLTLQEMENQLEDTRGEADEALRQLDETESTIRDLLQGVAALFKLCKCDKDPLLKLLGDNTSVKNYNVHLHLEILEKTIHQYLTTAAFKDKMRKHDDKKRLLEDEEAFQIYPIEKIVPATPCSLCVEHEMVADVWDKYQHVWSRNEVKARLTNRLKLPEAKGRLHTVSNCQLPKARRLIQTRYE